MMLGKDPGFRFAKPRRNHYNNTLQVLIKHQWHFYDPRSPQINTEMGVFIESQE
ncbi:MAG: hypothetical protein PVF06_06560 [Gammaproteobacteria bacterium]